MKKIFISICILSFVIFGCSKDNMTTDVEEATTLNENLVLNYQRLSQATTPGNFIIENGMLVFPDEVNFMQTEAFINNTTRGGLDSWRGNLTFETPAKAFLQFLEDTCCDKVGSEQALQAIEASYANRINIEIDPVTGEKVYSPKTVIFEELANINGIFKIGEEYYKVVDDKLFSVINGDLALVNSIDRNTNGVTSLDLGSPVVRENIKNGYTYIIEGEIETRDDDDCCSKKDTETTFYDQNNRKIKVSYEVKYYTIVYTVKDPINGDLKFYFPNAEVKSSVNNERKKSLIITSFWGCDKTNLSLNAAITFHATVDSFNFDRTYTFSDTDSNACWIKDKETFPLGFYLSKPSVDICVESVAVTGTNLNVPVSASLNCDIEEDIDPRVLFYKQNNAGGSVMCTIPLTNPVGLVNFKEDSYGCGNDDARSARFIDMRQGMSFRIYDDPNGSTNDDYVVITIKRNFTNKVLKSFEPVGNSENDDDWTVTYFEDNGLDGKVSSFRDN